MKLSHSKKQYIYEQIIDGADAVMVTKLIMYYGKVKFKDACLFRYEAVEWLKNEENKEEILSHKEKPKECNWKQEEENNSEEKPYDFQTFFNETEEKREIECEDDESTEKSPWVKADKEREGCVTCGCKDYSCGCNVKKVEEIPF